MLKILIPFVQKRVFRIYKVTYRTSVISSIMERPRATQLFAWSGSGSDKPATQ